MSERYTRIFSLQKNLYAEGSPVIVSAGALLKDTESSWLLAQLKLQNISKRAIKLLKVELTCLDSLGRVLEQKVAHQYLDLNVMRGESFGSQAPIKISNTSTRAFSVRVTEVGFADNSVWCDNGGEWTALPTQKPITDLTTDSDATFGYKATFGNNANLLPVEHSDIWLCTCGEVNNKDEASCYKCNADLASLKSLDINLLRKEGIYISAMNLYNSETVENLKHAASSFEKIIDYKDSKNLVKLCEEKIAEIKLQKANANKKRNKIIKLASIISGAAIVLGLLGYFVAYPFMAKASGDYSVIIDMYKIEEFTIPEGTKEIKDYEFSYCSSLTSVTIPDSVTSIGDKAFSRCSSLTSITIPDSVTSIGEWAFLDCSSLTSVTIPDSVTSIGSYAFCNCSSLKSVTIPDSVTSIVSSAFIGCSSLTSVTIPDSVTSIGDEAFYGCNRLESMTVPFVGATKDGTTNTHFGYIFGADSYLSNDYYVPESLKTVVITGGASIENRAFYECSSLTSVTIGDSITSIGSSAFRDCSSLTSVTIGDSITSIGEDAFYYCSSLTSINYNGTKAQWNAISKGSGWNSFIGKCTIYCIDGNIE